MQIIDSTPAALSADLQMYLRNGDVFFDIETTGLSWRTSHLYLIGALFFDPAADTFTLRQWFLDRPTEEKEMLVSFFTFLSDVKRLVHFNGTTFDLPYLTHKALFYQMEDPLSSIASLDLYQALRPFQKVNHGKHDQSEQHLQLVQSLDASKIVPLTVTWGGEEIKADAATTFTATKIFASDALTNGSLAKNLMFAQTTKGVLETGIYRGVVSIYLSQDI